MYDMWTIATGDPRRLPVCLSRGFTRLRCANTAERIEVLFGVETLEDQRDPDFYHGCDAAFAKLLGPFVGHLFGRCSCAQLGRSIIFFKKTLRYLPLSGSFNWRSS